MARMMSWTEDDDSCGKVRPFVEVVLMAVNDEQLQFESRTMVRADMIEAVSVNDECLLDVYMRSGNWLTIRAELVSFLQQVSEAIEDCDLRRRRKRQSE